MSNLTLAADPCPDGEGAALVRKIDRSSSAASRTERRKKTPHREGVNSPENTRSKLQEGNRRMSFWLPLVSIEMRSE